jgi:hypothetical protein
MITASIKISIPNKLVKGKNIKIANNKVAIKLNFFSEKNNPTS